MHANDERRTTCPELFFEPSTVNKSVDPTYRLGLDDGTHEASTGRNTYSETVSYEEYFRQIFGGLGVLPVFWSSQERLTRNIFRKYFSPKSYSGNISQKSAPRQTLRAQIFLGQQIYSQQIFGGVAVTGKHVGGQGLNPLTDSRQGTLHTETSILRIKRP